MDLDAKPFQCFITVAEEKSFSRSARRLNMSQPALSAQIRAFERRLGFNLFARTSRNVELTKEGRLFLGHAQRFVNESKFINRAARDIKANQLRLGAALETALIPERVTLVERFVLNFPQIELQILNENHAKSFASLSKHEIDIAVVVEPSTLPADITMESQNPGTESFSGLERLDLGLRPIELVVPIDNVLAAHAVIPFKALRGIPVATLDRFHGVALSEALSSRLTEASAKIVRAPEGNVLAVEQFGMARRIPAISLGWFGFYSRACPDFARRQVADFGFATHLRLVRIRGQQRPTAELFWEHAKSLASHGFR